jgi:hypothetical protein
VSALLTFSGSSEHDPAIDRWFDRRPDALGALAQQWFVRMRECGDDVRELFHDGCPVLCVQDAPFGYVNAFKAHVNVGFFHGASLPDPRHLLLGTGRAMRHVKLVPGETLDAADAAALDALVGAAYSDIVARVNGLEPAGLSDGATVR